MTAEDVEFVIGIVIFCGIVAASGFVGLAVHVARAAFRDHSKDQR